MHELVVGVGVEPPLRVHRTDEEFQNRCLLLARDVALAGGGKELLRLLVVHAPGEVADLRDGAHAGVVLAKLPALRHERVVDLLDGRKVPLHELLGALEIALEDADAREKRDALGEPQVGVPEHVLAGLLALGEEVGALLGALLLGLGDVDEKLGVLELELALHGLLHRKLEDGLVDTDGELVALRAQEHLRVLVEGVEVERAQRLGRLVAVLLVEPLVDAEGLVVAAEREVVVGHRRLHRPRLGGLGVLLGRDDLLHLVELALRELLLDLEDLEDGRGLGEALFDFAEHDLRVVGHHELVAQVADELDFTGELRVRHGLGGSRRHAGRKGREAQDARRAGKGCSEVHSGSLHRVRNRFWEGTAPIIA